MTATALPDWQRAYGDPVVSCQIRKSDADFQVTEQLGFELSDDGEHDYLQVEKTGANTGWTAQGLAKYAGAAMQRSALNLGDRFAHRALDTLSTRDSRFRDAGQSVAGR